MDFMDSLFSLNFLCKQKKGNCKKKKKLKLVQGKMP